MTREELLATFGKVEVREVCGAFVREISGDEAFALEEFRKADSGSAAFLARVVCATLCDQSGTVLLTADDAAAVRGWPFRRLSAIAEAALELNGLTDESRKAAEGN